MKERTLHDSHKMYKQENKSLIAKPKMGWMTSAFDCGPSGLLDSFTTRCQRAVKTFSLEWDM